MEFNILSLFIKKKIFFYLRASNQQKYNFRFLLIILIISILIIFIKKKVLPQKNCLNILFYLSKKIIKKY
jgi:hypothetical protein